MAIRAVANRGLLGVGFAFDPDIAAVARAVDFLEFVPFPRSASAIAFIGTPVQVSDILRPSRWSGFDVFGAPVTCCLWVRLACRELRASRNGNYRAGQG